MTNTVVVNNSIHQKKGGSSQNIRGTTLSMIQPNIKHHRDGSKRWSHLYDFINLLARHC